MKVENNQELINYYLKFCKRRKVHFKEVWIKTVFKRILNRDSAVKEAIESEGVFLKYELGKLNEFIKDEKIEREKLIDFKCSLTVYKEEGVGRIGFIMVYVALMLMTINIITRYLPISKDLVWLNAIFEVSAFIILSLVMLERGGISSRLSASLQLVAIIDRWLEINPGNKGGLDKAMFSRLPIRNRLQH